VRWKVNVGVGYTLDARVGGVGVSGDTVYVSVRRYGNVSGGLASGVLVALDRRDGRELWRYETAVGKHYFLDAPVPVAGGRVLVNDVGSGDVAAVDIATRSEAWRRAVGAAIRVRVFNQTVFTGGNDHAVGLDLATGTVRWTKPTGSSASGTGICQGNVFVSAFAFRRFEGATGELTGELGSEALYVSHVATDGVRAYATSAVGVIGVYCGAPPS
jgi:outer membrane protein assembly factor BamB